MGDTSGEALPGEELRWDPRLFTAFYSVKRSLSAVLLEGKREVYSILKALYRPMRSVGKAFWIVISSPVV